MTTPADPKPKILTEAEIENAILERVRATPFPKIKVDPDTQARSLQQVDVKFGALVGPIRATWTADQQDTREAQRWVKGSWAFDLILEFQQRVSLALFDQSISRNPIRVKCPTGDCYTLRPRENSITTPVEQEGPGTRATYTFEALTRVGLQRTF